MTLVMVSITLDFSVKILLFSSSLARFIGSKFISEPASLNKGWVTLNSKFWPIAFKLASSPSNRLLAFPVNLIVVPLGSRRTTLADKFKPLLLGKGKRLLSFPSISKETLGVKSGAKISSATSNIPQMPNIPKV